MAPIRSLFICTQKNESQKSKRNYLLNLFCFIGHIGLLSLDGTSASLIKFPLGLGFFTLGALRGLPDFLALPAVMLLAAIATLLH